MAEHRKRHKQYENGLRSKPETTVSNIFDKHGVENCKIELVEEYACNSKMELEKEKGNTLKVVAALIKL